MHEMLLRRWQVRPTLFDDWVELAGLYTSNEIAQLRAKGAFCVAIPVYPRAPENEAARPGARVYQGGGLSQPAQELTAQLRQHISLALLPELFPDILNHVVQVWRTPQAAASYFEKLLFDKRWADRPDAFSEAAALRDHYLAIHAKAEAEGQGAAFLQQRETAKQR
jgi:hypothetical protein